MKQTGKRIVSKGAYVKAQGKRASKRLLGTCLYVAAVVCGFFTVLTIYSAWELARSDRQGIFLFGCLMTVFYGAGAWVVRKLALDILKQATEIDIGIPLTRTNTADLSAPESLVRASAEPFMQPDEAQTVLLRAATESVERHEEQLVRASGKQETP